MANTATLTFNNNTISNNDSYGVIMNSGGSDLSTLFFFRTTSYHVFDPTIGLTSTASATSFANSFRARFKDFGGTNNISVSSAGPVVTITSQNEAITFVDGTGILDGTGTISISVSNAPPEEVREISFSLETNTGSECTSVILDLTVQGNDGLYEVELTGKGLISNNLSASNTQHVLQRDGIKRTLIVRDSTGVIGQSLLTVPRKIDVTEILTDVQNTSLGANLTITPTYLNVNVVPYEFSLNGGAHQTENIYSGLSDGAHDISVRDVFGCVTTKAINIDPYTDLTEIIGLVSEINAVRFVEVNDNKKSFRNTISCKVNKDVANKFTHKYIESDIFPTQLKTNAPYIRVYTIDSDLNESDLFTELVVENRGQQGRTSARVFSGNGKATLIYGDVSVYGSFGTDVLSYQDYGPFMPPWVFEGAFLNIEGLASGVKVERIYFDDGYNSFVAETNLNYSAVETEYIVLGVFNYNEYDVYEFLTTMSAESDNGFWIAIELGFDANNIVKKFLSEKIEKVEDSDDLLLIQYKDDENRGHMVYQTGIEHKIRIYGYSRYLGEEDVEGYNGDDQYYKVDDEIFRTEEFEIPEITEQIAHKLRLVTSHSTLIINDVPYKKYEAAEVETNFTTNEATFVFRAKPNGNDFIPSENENFIDENDGLTGAIESIEGKALILYTQNNG